MFILCVIIFFIQSANNEKEIKTVEKEKSLNNILNDPDTEFYSEKKHSKKYNKITTILITSGVTFLALSCCMFVIYKLNNFDVFISEAASAYFSNNSCESELSESDIDNSDDIENHVFYHSVNIINGGLGCFDGSRFFFSEDYLWSEDISGGNSEKIYDKTVYYLNPVEDYLYFTSPNEKDAICKIKKDGTDFKKIFDKYCHELTYYNGWLYFSSDLGDSNYKICRMRLDGSDLTFLADCRAWYMNIYNDKIFFCNYDDGRSIYSMNIDGSEYKLLRSGECCDLCVVENKIYFSTNMEDRNLHSVDLNGNNEEVLIGSYVKNTNYYNKKLYFVNEEGAICCCDLNGNNLQVLFNDSTSYTFITLLPGKICCRNSSNNELIKYNI